jgi:hypothetical protein
MLTAGGQQARTLNRFSDGSPEAVLYFPDTGGSGRACLTLPRNACISSAQFTVRGLPGPVKRSIAVNARKAARSAGWWYNRRQ